MLVWMLGGEALALSCLWGIADFNFEPGDVLPPDAVLVASHTFGSPAAEGLELALLDETGGDVAATIEWAPFVVTITPDEPLAAGEYVVYDGSYGYETRFTFQVAELASAEPLLAPEAFRAKRKIYRDLTWGNDKGLALSWNEVDGASHYEIQVAQNEAFDGATVAVSTWTEPFVGNGVCGDTIANYDHRADNYVRVRAVGIDGDVSAWTEPESVGPNAIVNAFSGCSVVDSRAAALPLLLVLGLLSARRQTLREAA